MLRSAAALARTTTRQPPLRLRGGTAPARPQRRLANDGAAAPPPPAPPPPPSQRFQTAAERDAYLREANNTMRAYHETRERMRQGKLPGRQQRQSAGGGDHARAQFALVGVFVAAFLAMPLLGRKIARDAEFRERWVPACLDYTVKAPEGAWTRQELHEQALAVQRDVRERAIRGEFTPDKLAELRRTLQGLEYPHREGMDRSTVPKEWDRIHPGLDEDGEDE